MDRFYRISGRLSASSDTQRGLDTRANPGRNQQYFSAADISLAEALSLKRSPKIILMLRQDRGIL